MNPKIIGAIEIVLPLIALIIALIAEGFGTMTIALALLVLTFIVLGVGHLTQTEEMAAPTRPGMPQSGMPGGMPPRGPTPPPRGPGPAPPRMPGGMPPPGRPPR